MKMYRLTVYVVDHEETGLEGVVNEIEACKYAMPDVVETATTEIGEWHDDIDINQSDAGVEVYERYFAEPQTAKPFGGIIKDPPSTSLFDEFAKLNAKLDALAVAAAQPVQVIMDRAKVAKFSTPSEADLLGTSQVVADADVPTHAACACCLCKSWGASQDLCGAWIGGGEAASAALEAMTRERDMIAAHATEVSKDLRDLIVAHRKLCIAMARLSGQVPAPAYVVSEQHVYTLDSLVEAEAFALGADAGGLAVTVTMVKP